ncbi:MAG: phage tail protein [Agromyces sp.]
MNPFLSTYFELKIPGLGDAAFAKCAGLSAEYLTEDVREGGENRFAHRFPAGAAWGNLVLTRGAAASTDLWDWWAVFLKTGRVAPRDGTIELYAEVDGALRPARVWQFQRAYPVKVSASDLDASASALLFETLELAHHGITVVEAGAS